MRNLVKAFLFTLLLAPVLSFGAKTFVVGTSYFYPPFIMRGGNNSLFGFDIELMQKLCKTLDLQCKFRAMQFAELPKALLSGKIDFAIASITITEERAEVTNFTIPYLLSHGRLLVRKDVPTNVVSKNFLDNKRIGVVKGSLYLRFIEDINPNNVKLLFLDEPGQLIEALMTNKLDVVITDNPAAIWWSLNSSGMVKTAGRPFAYGSGIGIAISKKNKSFVNEFNQAIQRLMKDGFLGKLYQRYFFHGQHHTPEKQSS
jgi:polar amino acid transport system substrate-binding protein